LFGGKIAVSAPVWKSMEFHEPGGIMEEKSKHWQTEEPDVEAHRHAQRLNEEPVVTPEEKADDDSDTPDVEAHKHW
jgi:hypothetical protein